MGSYISNMKCPNCSWKGCVVETWTSGDEWAMCQRCGYDYSSERGERKNPVGSWCCFITGGGQIGSIEDSKTILNKLKEHLKQADLIDECWFTFKKGKQWYVHDLIAERIMPFGRFWILKKVIGELEK